MELVHCLYCRSPFERKPGPGRPPKFCSRSHRQRHYESRRRGIYPYEIGERDGWRCYLCSKPLDMTSLVLDHVDPVSKGGTDREWNLRACCQSCNRRKHAKGTPESQVRLALH